MILSTGGITFANCRVETNSEKEVNGVFRDEKCDVVGA
jgi:hypothetical protein